MSQPRVWPLAAIGFFGHSHYRLLSAGQRIITTLTFAMAILWENLPALPQPAQAFMVRVRTHLTSMTTLLLRRIRNPLRGAAAADSSPPPSPQPSPSSSSASSPQPSPASSPQPFLIPSPALSDFLRPLSPPMTTRHFFSPSSPATRLLSPPSFHGLSGTPWTSSESSEDDTFSMSHPYRRRRPHRLNNVTPISIPSGSADCLPIVEATSSSGLPAASAPDTLRVHPRISVTLMSSRPPPLILVSPPSHSYLDSLVPGSFNPPPTTAHHHLLPPRPQDPPPLSAASSSSSSSSRRSRRVGSHLQDVHACGYCDSLEHQLSTCKKFAESIRPVVAEQPQQQQQQGVEQQQGVVERASTTSSHPSSPPIPIRATFGRHTGQRLCYRCGEPGHIASGCYNHPRRRAPVERVERDPSPEENWEQQQ